MNKKIQILHLHGGMTFVNDREYVTFLKQRELSLDKKIRWSDDYLDEKLGKEFEVIRPRMPLADNAKYRDWKIHFERYLALLTGPYLLVGSSLGGIFLAKYLSENSLPRKAISVFLICPPFDDTVKGERLVGGFKLGKDLSRISKNTDHLHLLFSADDETVPVSHAKKYKKCLPDAEFVVYPSKNGHFKIKTFPEIVRMIKKDVRSLKA